MSAQAQARTRARSAGSRRPTKAQRRRRRQVIRRRVLLVAFGVLVACALLAIVVRPFADKAVQEISLPLRHEDIIRQQASDKGLDPSLIAGVIYVESRFRDQTSHAGAKGLMQILPSTADYIARKSGGTAFKQGDLASPQINIAYGSWYLRYLIERYNGNKTLAVAAYNAGEDNVDKWVTAAGGPDKFDATRDIPFPETRAYVQGVFSKRDAYAKHYAKELGLK